MSLTSRLRALLDYANNKTEKDDPNLGEAIKTLVEGYNKGTSKIELLQKVGNIVINSSSTACNTKIYGSLTANGGMSYVMPCSLGESYKIKLLGDVTQKGVIKTEYNRFRVATVSEDPILSTNAQIPLVEIFINDNYATECDVTIKDDNSKFLVITVLFAGNDYTNPNDFDRKIEQIYKDILPSEYTQLNYIQSTGSQYIDTGYKPNSKTKIDVKYYPDRYSAFMCIYGTQNNTYNNRFYGLVSSTQFKVQINSWGTGSNPTGYYGINKNGTLEKANNGSFAQSQCIVQLMVDNANKKITVISSEYTGEILAEESFGESLNCNYNLLLLSRSNGGINANGFVGRLYKFKIYEDGELIQNLIPALRNIDGTVGMYDTVNGTFFTNAGTGTFSY